MFDYMVIPSAFVKDNVKDDRLGSKEIVYRLNDASHS